MNFKLPTIASAMLACCLAAEAVAAEPTQDRLEPFLKTYCLRCHDGQKQGGEFRLDTLPRTFNDEVTAQLWDEVIFRVNAGEMPPKDQPQPTADELGGVVEWIASRLKEGEATRMARRGPVAHYRLSRDEYALTVKDLLGVDYNVRMPGAFHEEPRWHGFDRIGSLLSLSPSHVDRYFNAAETVLDVAYFSPLGKTIKGRKDFNNVKWLAERNLTGRVRQPVHPGFRAGLMNVSAPGTFRLRIQLSGIQPPKGPAPRLSLWQGTTRQSVYSQDLVAPEDKPTILELELKLSTGGLEVFNDTPGFPMLRADSRNVFIHSRETRFLNPISSKLFDDEGQAIYPMLLVDWIEWEGPIISEEVQRKRKQFIPAKLDANKPPVDLSEARDALKRFAEQAWRRPASDAEVERYLKIVQSQLDAGTPYRTAYRGAMVGIMTSKNFYYLEEGSAEQPREQLNDWELASRLSYFLWSSTPDEELLAAAQTGKLRDPAGLKAQLTRMLADPKIARFTDSFPRQWLQLHRVGMFQPDGRLYPEYNSDLQRSMVQETTLFFDTVFRENLSLREFLDSDWTIVNPQLAKFYGMAPPSGGDFQKVKLRREDHRGGLLTQASVLLLTSDGTRHRPVHRGVWISEAIFGRTPPPPPPNVEPIEPTPGDKPKATIRMQLAAHATHATCASCHQKIDPLGFAFDNYDAIGRWRTEEQVQEGQGANPPVDATGKLPDGREYSGPDEFKRLLAEDLDRFAETFVEQLATYALRRVMTIDDREQIKLIAGECKKTDYQLRTVIENLVTSKLFLKR